MAEQTGRAPVAAMTLSGVSKRYGAVVALADVSMAVLPGEIHALLGENGAGKSTLMGVASGSTRADAGRITVDGDVVGDLTPARAARLGIAIVHQHPAVLPDMTVAENIRVGVPAGFLTDHDRADEVPAAMRRLLAAVGLTVHLEDRVAGLTVAQTHLLELATALARRPRILILDEPTAPLGADSARLLFDRVRATARAGTAVVHITHRLAEVRELAGRVTVLRDGHNRGTVDVDDVSDDELLALIIGRRLEHTFPPKHRPPPGERPVLQVTGLSGTGFSDVAFTAYRGEVVGVAGVVGNGQPELLRALAGLARFGGEVRIDDRSRSARELHASSAYLPGDRHSEGLMMPMSVRENVAVAALRRLRVGPFVSRHREVETVGEQVRRLRLRARSLETPVSALSGGNQQKVVLARALLSRPAVLLADEPTRGVDVGARAELYRILREVSAAGVPVVVSTSDAKELEGLCDRVIVMSRGHVVATLDGDEVTEERMVRAAVGSTTPERQERVATARASALRRRIEGDYAPVAILAAVMVLLGAYVYAQNARYLIPFNVTSVMLLSAALGFVALGQTVAMMVGGIDLSVGPLAGFLVVVGSFFLDDGSSGPSVVLGLVLMMLLAAVVGAVNGSLIRFGNFTAVAATLATYIALQGFSNLLRDRPGGLISAPVTDAITVTVGPVPVVFVLLVVLTVLLEFALRTSAWGLRLRAVGSREDAARSLGVPVTRTVVLAYVAVSVLTFLGALVLLAQLGIGDPAQGVGYTLGSIAAVVVGGTSLLGGRGSFVGTLLGTGLIIQLLNATTFLGLAQTWQYVFQGGLVVVAAIVYSRVRAARDVRRLTRPVRRTGAG